MTEAAIGLSPHPAVFHDKIMAAISELLDSLDVKTVFDPFAGTGRVHELRPRYETYGMEIEPEWANHNGYVDRGFTVVADANRYLIEALSGHGLPTFFDAIVTSPCYGNRMADSHEAKDGSVRNTYRHKLGRPLAEGNSGSLQWGHEYRVFHERTWDLVTRLLSPRVFVLNMKDHIRAGERQFVTDWHQGVLKGIGWELIDSRTVETPGNRYGANADLRVDYEHVLLFRR